ncbi:unnamed protein product [Amoebophrya sp. A25]|nr:unnamed protein product [Amoebophrya sp. A25]|eukprot:GSA25T00018281001.1
MVVKTSQNENFAEVDVDVGEVATPHSFTGRMCAGSRWEEHVRKDRLFTDPLAFSLAGPSGRRQPMGAWILVPRTRFGDDLLYDRYENHGARQLVLLGAGFDSRAYRMPGLEELKVFEVDQKTTFDVKERILKGGKAGTPALLTQSRHVVATEFDQSGRDWCKDLLDSGFDPAVPTVWLLEGLMMYLTPSDGRRLMRDVGKLSAPKSVVFHDGCSHAYIAEGVRVAGAPFVGGSDNYAAEWKNEGGFDQGVQVYDFSRDIKVDRKAQKLHVSQRGGATPQRCQGNLLVLFVVAEK